MSTVPPRGWSPRGLGDPFPAEKPWPFSTTIVIVIVIVYWAMQVDRLQPWHSALESAMHAAITALSVPLAIGVATAARQVPMPVRRTALAVGRWMAQRLSVKVRVSLRLGQA